ncbi:uncharacterized protein LOC110983304 [Acanthaster planci]|uniref:Uncharacterized protein LOC110983304 n=1 Tax=Acanthaster planci TaxID=133434 RepID=A0A8B7YXT2_ACAPL|nr:uncharacterized protein LOC110983304 [Acanthaster planci]XP_022098148.1 uncharacterized protein LOC110983304 [Acanthaster planci]XP_022098149.1 uncharacterized protein LOC110983304 [Acanthaster planci]XP_022098150.1 uncharacterized protein LOC110983304 [Acanthaster planci]
MASRASERWPLVPYPCLYIDASWKDVLSSLYYLTEHDDKRDNIKADIRHIWNSGNPDDHPTNHLILPCLSVRSAFDLFLRVKRYPPGSEILMTAVNIPQMFHIAQHHGLRVVPLDISIDTLAPKVDSLESLINENTVAVVIAHLYGRWSDIDDIINVCLSHNLTVLEDCAEVFCGLKKLGHPKADISFFSFGAIKPSTAFGGAVARVKDPALFNQMEGLYHRYPVQSRATYIKKILQVVVGMVALNTPTLMRLLLPILRAAGVDHKEAVVSILRGFPTDFVNGIRQQPSTALLKMMLKRFQGFNEADCQEGTEKCDFVSVRLPQSAQHVGMDVETRSYWLFPILVHEPDKVLKELNRRGVDAYRGATQLICFDSQLAGPAATDPLQPGQAISIPPDEARYLMDHVIYLPVHKRVPYHYLEKICLAVEVVLREETTSQPSTKTMQVSGKPVILSNGHVKVESKL